MKRSIKILTLIAVILGMNIPVKSQETQDKEGLRFYNSGMDEAAIIYFKKVVAASGKEAVEKAEANYYIANSFINLKMPDSAIIYFNKGIEQDPTYLYNNIGLTGLTVKDPEALEAAFKAAIKLEKKEINVYLAIVRACISQKDYVNADKYIERAIKVDKTSGMPYLLKGDIALAENKYVEAAQIYESTYLNYPDLIGAHVKFADVYMQTNNELSITTLKDLKTKLEENNDGFKGIDLLLGEIYFGLGKGADAVAHYASFIEGGNYTENHFLDYALALYIDKQYDKVLDITTPVLQKQPNNLIANRINAYAKAKIETGDEGLSYIKNFVENTPKNKIIALDYVALGEKLDENKFYGEATENYKNAIALDSNRRYLYESIADAYVKVKEIDSAARYYDMYLNIAGREDLLVQFKYGRSLYAMATGLDSTMLEKQIYFLQKADMIFETIVELAPDQYIGYLWRARVNAFMDMETTLGLAKPYYEKVVEISLQEEEERKNELSEAYRYLGYYYYVQAEAKATVNPNKPDYKLAKEEYLKSKEYFSKVLGIEPENAIAQQVIEVINKLNLEK
jgi:tetratricopeptide (TPR) repeat protein